MNNPALNCPKCESAMEEGFIVDYGAGGDKQPSGWVEGEPVKSFWTGTKISGKTQLVVTTYRCAGCGYLESYATKPVSKYHNLFR